MTLRIGGYNILLRYASWALLVLLVLGLVLAILPSPSVQAAQGVRLTGVSMRLYPQQDPNAVWKFETSKIQYDPIEGVSTLSGVQIGERHVKGKLDMTLTAPGLEIDRSDNLHSKEAVLYIPAQCSTLNIKKDVEIRQDRGFIGNDVHFRAANLNMTASSIDAPFDLGADTTMTDQVLINNMDNPETCQDGKIVPKPEEKE